MKNKLSLLMIAVMVGQSALAGAIMENPRYYTRPPVKSSSIVYSNRNVVDENDETYKAAVKEIQKKIEQSPSDYGLYINLASLYIKLNDFQKASDELIYLKNLERQKKLNSAVQNEAASLLETLRKTPKSDKIRAYYYTNMAILALILEDKSLAADYIVVALNGNCDENFMKHAVLEVVDGLENVQTSINICDRVLQKKTNDIDIRRLKASYLIQADDKNSAFAEYSKILDMNPKDEDAKYSLYKLLAAKNASEKEVLKTLYKTDKPDLETAYSELADILLKNNDTTGAVNYAKLLTEKFPDNANGYIILSEIYRREGKLKESYDVLAVVRDKADTNEEIAKYNVLLAKLSDAPLQEANSLMSAGLYAQALEVLESASQENLYVILAQSRANYFLKNKQKALDLLNKAMTLYPNNSDVYCAFAYIYLQEDDVESARKYVNGSLKINSENRTALTLLDLINNAETKKFHGKIASCVESQNYTEAVRLINEAKSINKKDSALYYYMGLIYIAQNNYSASTAELYKCLEYDPDNILANFYLGIAFDNLSEKSNALMYYQKYIGQVKSDDFGESERKEYAKARIQKLKG